ncbi:hypothetical protein BG20_I1686 [Candidatus Nitrosarchaeum limnium BG20]|uniref:Uncharacterized protein n=1 Tax=Candidatus Nitrosarchaeum limnium BG20 TaxID=859192 RepID=S2EQ06_9ARCH|nr:hypothetical protein BG20_I1686 [Candidatus Nitrosarchaeum limnium BG20]
MTLDAISARSTYFVGSLFSKVSTIIFQTGLEYFGIIQDNDYLELIF